MWALKDTPPLKFDTSIDCSTILSQGIPIVLSVDKSIMFSTNIDKLVRASTAYHDRKLSHKAPLPFLMDAIIGLFLSKGVKNKLDR